jgi:signal transduction histidine kinase
LQLEIQPVDLVELANERCELLSNLAARQGVELRVASASHLTGGLASLSRQNPLDSDSPIKSGATHPLPRALADPDRLSQILDNLLDNAIHHSPANSTITVSIEEKDEGIECSVADQGMGIPAEHLPFIFERFYRVDKSRTRKDGGAGLGLAIARVLILAMSGRISAQSVEGEGTTITFWLPTKTPMG